MGGHRTYLNSRKLRANKRSPLARIENSVPLEERPKCEIEAAMGLLMLLHPQDNNSVPTNDVNNDNVEGNVQPRNVGRKNNSGLLQAQRMHAPMVAFIAHVNDPAASTSAAAAAAAAAAPQEDPPEPPQKKEKRRSTTPSDTAEVVINPERLEKLKALRGENSFLLNSCRIMLLDYLEKFKPT